MYLQFGPRPKKMRSNDSAPLFGLDRHPKLKSDSPPKPFPSANLNLSNKTNTQSDLMQNYTSSIIPLNYADRLKNDELADDLMALKQRMRILGPQLSNSQHNDKHTKHKILNRHQAKPDRTGNRSPGKDLAQSGRLDAPPVESEYFSRRHSPAKPFYQYSQDPPPAFLASSRHEMGQVQPSMQSTMSVFSYEQRQSSLEREEGKHIKSYMNATVPRDQDKHMKAEIAKLQEDNIKQEVQKKKILEECRRHQEDIRRQQDQIHRIEHEAKRYKDIAQGHQEINKTQLLELIDRKKDLENSYKENKKLEEKCKVIQAKLKEAQVALEDTVSSEKQVRQLRNQIVVLEIELEEKNCEIKFLSQKILKSKQQKNIEFYDINKYEETIDSLQRQIRQLKAQKLSAIRPNADSNETLRQNTRLKNQLQRKEQQIHMLEEELTIQKYKFDNSQNDFEVLRLHSMIERKNLKSELEAKDQNSMNQIGSLKKLIFALEEKLRIAVNDNIRKDEFVKTHILTKTKSEYDRADIQSFFKNYLPQMPKDSLSKSLSKQHNHIRELQQRIEQLQISLAAKARYSIGVQSTQSLGK